MASITATANLVRGETQKEKKTDTRIDKLLIYLLGKINNLVEHCIVLIARNCVEHLLGEGQANLGAGLCGQKLLEKNICLFCQP